MIPDIPPGWVALLVAAIAGPVVVMIQNRAARKSAAEARESATAAKETAERVEQSVGPMNGHGTMQDQGAAILARLALLGDRLAAIEALQHSMQTSVDSIVGGASTVNQRLKAHDRELAEHDREIDALKRGGDAG